MIRLVETSLPPHTRAVLLRWQRELDQFSDYQRRVEEAKATWKKRNKKENKTFSVVREKLLGMCAGARRCCYCQDSCADEVEHIKPKSLYPEATYVWDNYLYACGRCNGRKKAQFAVFSTSSATPVFVDVTRPHNAPVRPPAPGTPVFIDPRTEDPADFLTLDIRDTFHLLIRAQPDSLAYRRAEYTIDRLGLNKRDELVQARREAFASYRARLREYVTERDEGVHPRALHRKVEALKRMQHPFVWAEMKRSYVQRNDLAQLFAAAPEALTW